MRRISQILSTQPILRLCVWGGLLCFLLGSTAEVFAQRYQVLPGPNQPRKPRTVPAKPAASAQSKTLVNVELVTGTDGVGLQAQTWRPLFEQMGVDVQIRSGNINDKPEIKESEIAGMRRVTVIGQLDRQGRIILADRVFTRDQSANLAKYLEELKTFGPQGNPFGKPLWGLNAEQFSDFYKAFSGKVDKPATGKTLAKAIEELGISEAYPIRMSKSAEDWLASEFPSEPAFRQSVEGFSRGTAFALLLNEYGLGFKPVRTPAATIEIEVETLQKTTDVWPVGWQLKDSRQKTAPGLFQLGPIDLENVPLLDVLNAVSLKAKIPVRYDHYRIEAQNLDLSKMLVNYPPRQTSYSLLLRGATNAHLLAYDLKIDELGQPFLWIAPLKLGKLGR
jgi:hypothetical protein